jgi:3-dehydroquinate synthase
MTNISHYNSENGRILLKLTLVKHEDLSYPIIIGSGILSAISVDLKTRGIEGRLAIITDTNVLSLYGIRLESELREAGFQAKTFVFAAGEENKTLKTCEDIVNSMSAEGFGRDTTVIALGGGVVGDVAGFVASGFNRGVPCIQIPTTLVAQADSAIGGKTGVDTKFGKNLFGAFKQPKAVYIDTAMLRTLPQKEYSCGLAETVKHAVILDAGFFDYLEKGIADITGQTDDALLAVSEANCRIKKLVVEKDPEELGIRRILNFGHTVGHAIEKLGRYKIPHGYCVAIGVLVESRIASEVTGFPKGDIKRVERLLGAFGLPTKMPESIGNEEVLSAAILDKKSARGKARYALPIRIGQMAEFNGDYATYVEDSIVRNALSASR